MEAKEPCIDCPDINRDEYGYICDLTCGKRTAWLNYMEGFKAGRREVVKWIYKNAGMGAETIEELSKGRSFIPIRSDKWQAQLKEWGIEG